MNAKVGEPDDTLWHMRLQDLKWFLQYFGLKADTRTDAVRVLYEHLVGAEEASLEEEEEEAGAAGAQEEVEEDTSESGEEGSEEEPTDPAEKDA